MTWYWYRIRKLPNIRNEQWKSQYADPIFFNQEKFSAIEDVFFLRGSKDFIFICGELNPNLTVSIHSNALTN